MILERTLQRNLKIQAALGSETLQRTSRDPVKSRREYKDKLYLAILKKERNVLGSFNQFFEDIVLNSLYE